MGQGNKPILIGVYTGDIIVAEFPATIWLGFFIDVKRPDVGSISTINLELHISDKVVARFEMAVPEPWPTDTATLTIPSGLLNLEGPTTIELIGEAEGFERTTFISKRVFHGEVSLA